MLCSAKLWKNSICIAFLLIATLGKWMDFIFNEDPDHVSKNSVLCSLHFTTDLFTNKAHSTQDFQKGLKLKDNAVPTILDRTVMLPPHKCK